MSYEFETNKYSNLRYLIGDVRDLDRLEMATFGGDYIFHAAAMNMLRHQSIMLLNV